VLRVIAQAERISEEHLRENLRYPASVIRNALHLAVDRGWVIEADEHYSLSWHWFRTITRVLARQNLLAGVR
jgi:DNA-binding IclR family transcriptional regulator